MDLALLVLGLKTSASYLHLGGVSPAPHKGIRFGAFPFEPLKHKSPPMDRKEYIRDYHEKMKGRVKRVSLTLSVSEYREFELAAKLAGEKPASFIKSLALQALRKEVALPEAVESELAELTRLVRSVANNVNQMARHSNRIARVLDDNEPLLEVAKLDGFLRATLKKLASDGA